MLKNKIDTLLAWQPSANLECLRLRAKIYAQIRHFFAERQVMEVETPLMCHTSVTDPFIQSIPALFQSGGQRSPQQYYLQTSPEYAMKRLLAAGSGSIFQICKAFRQGEIGRLHNPEFTMIEWYRLGFTHHELMDEMDELLQLLLKSSPAERITYSQLFQKHLQIDVETISVADLQILAQQKGINIKDSIEDKDTWLNLLLAHCIEPNLGKERPCFIFDFPASQAALARLSQGVPPTACRFEVYINGTELANGFYELQDAAEQRRRFNANLAERHKQKLAPLPIDEFFLSALENGLPDCSGVALGLDRLIMIAADTDNIADVLAFDFSRV